MKALVFLTLGVFVICIRGCGAVKNEENVAPSSTTMTFNTQEVQPPQLLEYYPKKLAFLPEEPILLYFDKKPTAVTANFGDVSIEGNNVMITNADRFKNPYTVTWKGGSVDLVFEYTGLLDSVGESVLESQCFSFGRKNRPLGKDQNVHFFLDVWSKFVLELEYQVGRHNEHCRLTMCLPPTR